MLPLVWHDYQSGNRPTIVTSAPWVDLLDGIGYAERLVWNGPYSEPLRAKAWVQGLRKFSRIDVPQCFGQNISHECPNYCEEAWRIVGKRRLWNRLPLIFDRRNKQREEALIRLKTEKPLILLITQGLSSPFSHAKDLTQLLSSLETTHQVLDISFLKAERFFDLLGLMEQATYLVTIDTGPLHLAEACPNLNVIALISDAAGDWFGSPNRKNHLLRIPYKQYQDRKNEIPDVIQQGLVAGPRLFHVWSKYTIIDMGAQRRHRLASLTWQKEMSEWIDLPLLNSDFARTSKTEVRESKVVPFVKDMVEIAMNRAQPWDIVVLTNDDTCVAPGLTQILRDVIKAHGACWGARREHPVLNRILGQQELMRGWKHCGGDLFAFSKWWWLEYRDEIPDMLLAFEDWDYVMRTVIEGYGGVEVEGLCYHEVHTGAWLKHRQSPGARHNQDMSRKFFEKFPGGRRAFGL